LTARCDVGKGKSESFAPANEESIGADHERAGLLSDQGCKRRIEVAFGARMQDMELEPERAGRAQIRRIGAEEPDHRQRLLRPRRQRPRSRRAAEQRRLIRSPRRRGR
jgi:hypothetical protein